MSFHEETLFRSFHEETLIHVFSAAQEACWRVLRRNVSLGNVIEMLVSDHKTCDGMRMELSHMHRLIDRFLLAIFEGICKAFAGHLIQTNQT